MRNIIKLLFIFIYVASSGAQEVEIPNSVKGLNCRLRAVETKQEYLLGEPLKMELVLWPKQQLDLGALQKKLQMGSLFIDAFYLYSIGEIKSSANNADAVVIALGVVPVKPFDLSIYPIYSDGKNSCMVEVKGFKFSSEKLKPQVTLLKQQANPLPSQTHWGIKIIWAIIILLLFVFLGWWFYRWKKKKEVQAKRLMRQDYFKTLIEQAKERHAVERFYLLRNEWESLNKRPELAQDFFEVIKPILYKKQWSDDELLTCLEKLEKLKEGFDD